MKCPKCNVDITENMLVCPNCRKVLKLVCPKCNTINKTNNCQKCGFVIITKCHKCGKINQTINGACLKCGFSTYTSVAINSSNIDEFACLTIEFPNLADIKSILGSTKLTNKFKANLDRLILNYAGSVGVTREIIEDVYIIRFNKDFSFRASANNAMKAAIEIQNTITELNFKLNKLKNALLQCNIAVLKRDINSKPDQYKSGFDIKLIYQNKGDLKLLNSLQVVTDTSVYEQVCDNFDLSSLSSTFVKNEMVMFFDLKLKNYIKIPKPKEEDEETDTQKLAKLNYFDNEISDIEPDRNELYDVDAINFNELKCTFAKVKSLDLIPEILERLRKNRKEIISVKGDKELLPEGEELLDRLGNLKLFKNIFRVTCYDEMKYKPYGFFYELISNMYNFSLSPKNFYKNKFEMFRELDETGFIKNLINLTERKTPHPEDIRYSLFDIFFNVFRAMSQSLIYIENFEKIDKTSYEVLQFIFEEFNKLNISFLIVTDKDFSLHKDSHFLLANPNYIEISAKPTPFKEIIGKNIKKYENILDSYCMRKISQNAKGSVLYFDDVMDYLVDRGLLTFENGNFSTANLENILIPANLNELIAKKLKYLSKDKETYNLFGMLLLTGSMVDLSAVELFGSINSTKILQKLIDKKYIYIYNNRIYIQNYSLYKENFIAQTPLELKQTLAKELLTKVFSSQIRHPAETVLYKILGQEKQEFIVWENLSHLNASMGDFSAYLNCSIKFLKLLDNHINENSEKTIEEYKLEVYENISNLLYRYTPNEIHNIAQIILNNLEQTTNDKKIINLCNKMLQGCLIGGNYSYALDLIQKILSRFPGSSIDPKDRNFNLKLFLISLIKIEILFSIGNLKDCVESGEEILEVLSPENIIELKPEHLSVKQFEEVIFSAMSFVAIAKIILLQKDLNDFIAKIPVHTGKLPKVFDLLRYLEKMIRGIKVEIPSYIKTEEDKFSKITINIIRAFNGSENNYRIFADSIHQAKINAKAQKLLQIELLCDLLIGYSYFKLNNAKKAASIYYNVLETSTKNGLKMITYLDWYFISVLKFEQQDIEVAFGIANNALIQLEKDNNSSDFLFFLFRILLSKILMAKNDTKSAELCLNNAKFLKGKYGLNFDVRLDLEDNKVENMTVEEIK